MHLTDRTCFKKDITFEILTDKYEKVLSENLKGRDHL
jgi:hypothetical protein